MEILAELVRPLWSVLCVGAAAFVYAQTNNPSQKCAAAARLTFDQAEQIAVEKGEARIPPRAREVQLQGVVRIEACVSETGEVILTKPVSGHPILIPPALESAVKWRFKPLVVNGRPVPFQTILEIWFTQGNTPAEVEDQIWYILAESRCRDSLQAHKLDAAAQQCQQALDLAEKLPKGRTNERRVANGQAGQAFFAQRKFDAALGFFRQELEIASQSLKPDDAELAYAHHHVARALHGLGNAKDAKGHYERAEQILMRARDEVDSGSLKEEYTRTLGNVRSNYLVLLTESGETSLAAEVEKRLKTGR